MSTGLAFDMRVDLSGIDRLQERLRKLSNPELDELLESVAGEVESQSRRRIGEERRSPEGEAWEPWSERYAKKRKGGHQLLQSEGHLLDSIQYSVGVHSATVGSNLIYAAIHQHGGEGVGRPWLPARPYLGISQENQDDIVSVIDDFIDAVMSERA